MATVFRSRVQGSLTSSRRSSARYYDNNPNNLLTNTLAGVAPTVTYVPRSPLFTPVRSGAKFEEIEFLSPNLLLTTLAVVAAPFSSNTADDKLSERRDSAILYDQYQNLLLTASVAPFFTNDVQVTQKHKAWVKADVQNLLPLSQTLPFASGDWTVVFKRRFVQPVDAQNSVLSVFGAANPFVSGDWTTTFRRNVVKHEDIANLLPITQTLAFTSNDYTVFKRHKFSVPEDATNSLLTSAVAPFASGDWAVSRNRKFYEQVDSNNLVPGGLLAPFASGDFAYETLRRKVVYPDNVPNLSTATFVQVLPPGQSVFPDVVIRRRLVAEANQFNLPISVVTQNPFVPFDYQVQFARKRLIYEDAPNYLLTAAVQPFTPNDFQYPARRRFVVPDDVSNLLLKELIYPFQSGDWQQVYRRKFLSVEDVQNLLPLSQPGAPFLSGDWQVGYRRKFTTQVEFNNFLPLVISLTPFLPVEQHYPPLKRSRVPYDVFTTFNLPTATFVPPSLPPQSGDWYVEKQKSRRWTIPDVYANLLTSTLAPTSILVSDPAYTVSLDEVNYTVSLGDISYTVGSNKPMLYTVRGKVRR